MFTPSDHQYMARALKLAEQGLYTTMPNPRVGCVIVKNGSVIGEGAHLRAGESHAEVHALGRAGAEARGADVYVTLEPCSHHGRTPPCADALINAGVGRVFVAMQDPNPKVAGDGITRLMANGIAVKVGLMEAQARDLNPGFVSRMTRDLPFVRCKIAASLDGRTALVNGTSKWITGECARKDVQHWRARSCAILTGVGTVLADNPQMNVRAFETGRQPLRVVADSRLSMSLDASILQGGNVLVAYAQDPYGRAALMKGMGVELLHLPDTHGRVDLEKLLKELSGRGINEVLVEAGQGLNGALLQEQLIDEFLFYYAPVLLGSGARGMFDIPELTEMRQGTGVEILDIRQFGRDIRLRARPRKVAVNAG